jgi:hypothetical protein
MQLSNLHIHNNGCYRSCSDLLAVTSEIACDGSFAHAVHVTRQSLLQPIQTIWDARPRYKLLILG